MKKKLCLCLATVIFLLWGCAPITNDESSSQQEPVEEILYEEEREFLTFDEAIERSTDVVVAEFVKDHTDNGYKDIGIDDSTYIFNGKGWGHGVGISQYGI